jgi:3-oxoadipate enol-lactonase
MAIAKVSGRKVYYEVHQQDGASDEVPLILLTGTGGSCRGWLPLQVPAFSKSRKTIIFDHRGVMESEDPGGPFSTRDLAEDTRGLLDALEIERADVMGAFMGGMAAQELALGHPERVRRLVLVGTYSRPLAKQRMLLEDWIQLARHGVPQETIVRTRLLWTLEDATLEQTDLIDGMIEFFNKEGAPVSADLFARQCEACLGHDTEGRLHAIHHPTLILCGRHDRLTPVALHQELAKQIEHSRLVIVQFGAHLVMAESAERFNQVVEQYLDSDDV